MKLRSFRLRIALLSAALAGSALVGFGIVTWRLLYVAKVSRLDAKLEVLARRTVRPRSQDWWKPFAASLPRELSAETDTPIVMLVINANGEIIYQSTDWSTEFDLRALMPSPSSQTHLLPSLDERNTTEDQAESELYPNPLSEPLRNPKLITRHTASGSWRIGAASSSHAQSAIAVSLQTVDQEMATIRHIFLIAISGTLLLVAGGAWGLSGSALRPIRKLTGAIQQVTVTGLDQRIPVEETDVEFVELIQVFNQMLERLGRSFKQSSRFSADAAHELKTPLAILQGELEQQLQHAVPGSEAQQQLSNLLDEVRRLSGIVRKLLLLSLADAGQMSLYTVHVDLLELLTVIAEDVEMLAPHLTIQANISDELWVWGDRDLLTQVLQNLVSNAIKYNLPDGWIQIKGQCSDKAVQVTISNSSNDIPACDRDRIFDRFYRGDPARTRKVEGVGLGLSLSREIVRAHSGDLTLDVTPPGQTAFTLTLPIKA